jgi:hypothetical protein
MCPEYQVTYVRNQPDGPLDCCPIDFDIMLVNEFFASDWKIKRREAWILVLRKELFLCLIN